MTRGFLEPLRGGKVILGHVADQDQYLEEHDQAVWEDWASYWAFCEGLFAHVTKATMEELEIVMMRVSSPLVLLDQPRPNAAFSLLKLYDYLADQPIPPLLADYASPVVDALPPAEPELGYRALAHVNPSYGLADSQRGILHRVLGQLPGSILAVTGPPGTGKTSLIQSMVANLWVNHALAEREPPVVVVTSTNNQALLNVMHSFSRGTDGEDAFASRWLPKVSGFGLFCPSHAQVETLKQQKVLYTTDWEKGFPEILGKKDYLVEAETVFMENLAAQGAPHFDRMDDVVAWLHEQLRGSCEFFAQFDPGEQAERARESARLSGEVAALETKVATLKGEIKRIGRIQRKWLANQAVALGDILREKLSKSFVEKRNRALFLGLGVTMPPELDLGDDSGLGRYFDYHLQQYRQELEQAEVAHEAALTQRAAWLAEEERVAQAAAAFEDIGSADVQMRLDTGPRRQAFWWATHYWEARWLADRLKAADGGVRKRKKSVAYQQNRWWAIAKLTPCLGATTYSVPKFFNLSDKPLSGFIDWLIIDEAGQVAPELAGAGIALAKRAVVIGDEYQIAPVAGLPRHIEQGNRRECGLNDHDLEFEACGLMVTEGSAMKAADFKQRRRGVRPQATMLLEHYRCVPEVIAFCNQSVYGGRLIAKRKPLEKRCLPAMGYAHVPGHTKRRKQGSLHNEIEAEVIISWLVARAEELCEFYGGRPMSELVAVVTPYAAQAQTLRRRARQEIMLKDLTIGTIHVMQGDERPVVLFSSVVAGEETASFINSDVAMLNVAVSRAQDSFLVFGDMNVFAAGEGHTANLARNHLFADQANEIRDFKLPKKLLLRRSGAKVRHLTDTQTHMAYLARVFEAARERILLVSPFISIRALMEADLLHHIEEAVQRGREVLVYTDAFLDLARTGSGKPTLKPNAAEGRAALAKVGVQVREINNIHSKTLCMDRRVLIEGSFNWLSAVRRGPYCRYEAGLCYADDHCEVLAARIDQLADFFEKKWLEDQKKR
ncbi:AAA domain-containing protein [Acanthopleuribacter pedis]|uniref:Uncharacterized protein n=1 Tax=Acanthopleuribacter pedis TaxID=442870 RepID=A0A8J7U2V8_9BACT|nr:AAA domain-containing protein [Acanthopleuribacter pedis]MBO1317683.1 hypothetical protein [Acanthopleuribacter pedis]